MPVLRPDDADDELLQGIEVEREHAGTIQYLKDHPELTVDQAAELIARDHLGELPDYYTRLKDMEAGAESLISRVRDGALVGELCNALTHGGLALRPLSETSDAHSSIRGGADAAPLRTYFGSYGELRFTSMEGVLVQQPTSKMQELIALSMIEASNHRLNELFNAYEGTVDELHDHAFKLVGLTELLAQRQRPSAPPDPQRSLSARQAAQTHASSREAAARKSAVSAKGKAAHAAVGRLNSRSSR